MRDFARKHDIEHYFEIGRRGHRACASPRTGLVCRELVVGADSHTLYLRGGRRLFHRVGSHRYGRPPCGGNRVVQGTRSHTLCSERSPGRMGRGRPGSGPVHHRRHRSRRRPVTDPWSSTGRASRRCRWMRVSRSQYGHRGRPERMESFAVDERTRAWAAAVSPRSFKELRSRPRCRIMNGRSPSTGLDQAPVAFPTCVQRAAGGGKRAKRDRPSRIGSCTTDASRTSARPPFS